MTRVVSLVRGLTRRNGCLQDHGLLSSEDFEASSESALTVLTQTLKRSPRGKRGDRGWNMRARLGVPTGTSLKDGGRLHFTTTFVTSTCRTVPDQAVGAGRPVAAFGALEANGCEVLQPGFVLWTKGYRVWAEWSAGASFREYQRCPASLVPCGLGLRTPAQPSVG